MPSVYDRLAEFDAESSRKKPYDPFESGGRQLAEGFAKADAKAEATRVKTEQRDALARGKAMETAMRADPISDEISTITRDRTNIQLQRQASKANLKQFMERDGADFFELDPTDLTGRKHAKNPDGSPMIARRFTEDLMQKRLLAQQTGPEAERARAEVAATEKEFRLKKEKYDRITKPLADLDALDAGHVQRLGQLAGIRQQRDSALGTPAVNPLVPPLAPEMGQPAEMAPAQPAVAPAQGMTPAAIVKAHAQMKQAEAAGDVATVDALRSQIEAGMGSLDEARQQRVMKVTKDPTFWGEVGRNAKDMAMSFGSGANSILKMAGDLYGLTTGNMGNALSAAGKEGAEFYDSRKSPEIQAAEQARQAAIESQPDELGKAWAFVRETVSNPALMAGLVTENIPNAVGAGGAGAVARVGAEKLLLRSAATAAAKQAAARKAASVGVGVAVGTGAAMQGADVGAGNYDELVTALDAMPAAEAAQIPEIADLMERGATLDAAKLSLALTQARKTGVLAGALSVAAQNLPGAKTIERAVVGGAAKKGVGRLASAGVGAAGEAVSEVVEEVGGKMISNVEARPVDPERPIMQGTGETAAQAALAAGVMGGAAGALNVEPPAAQTPPPAATPTPPAPAAPTAGAAPVPPAPATPPAQPAPAPSVPQPQPPATNAPTVTATPPAPVGQKPAATEPVVKDSLTTAPAPAEADVTLNDQAKKTFEVTNAKGETATVETARESEIPAKLPAGFGDIKSIKRVESSLAPKLEGEKINKEWTAFAPESQSLGIPRADMPQVKAEHRGALTQFLKARDILSEETEVRPGELKPTQAEFSPAKVEKARGFKGGDRAILVSSDNHVVDGHHQWMAKLADAPDEFMRVIKLDAPIQDVLAQMKEFPSVENAKGATTSKAGMVESQAGVPTPSSEATAPAPTPATPAPASLTPGGVQSGQAVRGSSEATDVPPAPVSPQPAAPSAQPQKSPTPAPTRAPAPAAAPSAPKPPVVARGANKPATFIKAVAQASGIKAKDKATRFLQDFAPRLHKANPKAFENMEVHVLNQAEWAANERTGAATPDSAAAYNPETNTLYFNSDKMTANGGADAISAVVHEAGHFAEKFALGEDFTQREWLKLKPEQRIAAWNQYTNGDRSIQPDRGLQYDKRARAEWVAMQFARVVRGDTDQMASTMLAKLKAHLEMVRELVRKWIGDKSLTTKELDSKILDMMGYAEKGPQHTLVGQNAAGKNVYQDERGARHIEQVKDILVSEPVGLVPTRTEGGGIEIRPNPRTAKQREGTEFETVAERDARKAVEKPAEPTPAPEVTPETPTKPAPVETIAGQNGIEVRIFKNTEGNFNVIPVDTDANESFGYVRTNIKTIEQARAIAREMLAAKKSDTAADSEEKALIYAGLLRQWGIKWQWAVRPNKNWMTSDTKEGAIEQARKGMAALSGKPTAVTKPAGEGATATTITPPAPKAATAAKPDAPTPAAESKPAQSKADALAAARAKAKASFDLLGTPAEPDKQIGFPDEILNKFVDLAKSYIAAEIKTPDALARELAETIGPKARKYTRALWKIMEGQDSTLPDDKHDWNAIYAAIDKPAQKEDAAPQDERPLEPITPRLDEGESTGKVEGSDSEPSGNSGSDSGESGSGAGSAGTTKKGGSSNPRGPRVDDGNSNPATSPGAGGASTDGQGVREDRPALEPSRGADVRADQDLRIQPEDTIVPGGRKSRINANIRAIRLLRELGDKAATPAQKRVLVQFSGWGDTFQVFGDVDLGGNRNAGDIFLSEQNNRKPYLWGDAETKYNNWKRDYGETFKALNPKLGGLMTEAEFQSAKESSLNAHYTSREIINRIWSLVERFGFKGGKAIEPSAGIGHFIGLAPDSVAAKTNWVGVELDSMTGALLKKLYPQQDIQITGFENSLRTQNNAADLVISNFPFGDYQVADPSRPDYDGQSIHNYFLGRSVDAVKPGGLVVAITSRFTLDGTKARKLRESISEKANFVGAIRLPQTAFKDNAGTSVVTDVMIFQKKGGPVETDSQRWTQSLPEKIEGTSVNINEYFTANPSNIIGKPSLQGSMYGGNKEYTVDAPADKTVPEAFDEIAARMPANIMSAGQEPSEKKMVVAGAKTGSYVVREGKVYQIDDQGQATPAFEAAADNAKAKQLIGIRDALTKQMALEANPESSDEEIAKQRKAMNALYDAFYKKHGALNDESLLEEDPEWPLVASLEDEEVKLVLNKAGKNRRVTTYVKGAPLLKRFNYPYREPTSAQSVDDAISISIAHRAKVDPTFIAKLVSRPVDEVSKEIVESGKAFRNPDTGTLEIPEIYLSGFVRLKLEVARRMAEESPEFKRNVEALEKVQPPRQPIERTQFRLGSSWIPTTTIQRLLRDVFGVNAKVALARTEDSISWEIETVSGEQSAENTSRWGVQNESGDVITGAEMVLDSLNLKLSKMTKEVSVVGDDGRVSTKIVDDLKGTAAARDMQNRIQEEFRRWAMSEAATAKELEEAYDNTYGGITVRKTSEPDFEHFPGASPLITLRPWQKRAARRASQEATLLSHSVGTGKTFTLITAAMELRRLGSAKKPMVVVQNSTIGQFARSFRTLYPNANILVAPAASKPGVREKFISMATTREWDAVIVPISFFERIPNDPIRERGYVNEQLDMIEDAIRSAEGKDGNTDKPKSSLGKLLAKARKRAKARLDRIMARVAEKSDNVVVFENMGVDALLVDEAHAFKRGDFFTKMESIKGLDTNGSDRSLGFYLKTQFIHTKTPDRNVILATGTPISNTLAEMWTMARYVKPNFLRKFGVNTFDDFVGSFAIAEAAIEETPTGGFKQVLRLAKYVNGPAITNMWRTVADVYKMNRADLKDVPKIKGGGPQEVTIERSPELTKFVDFLTDWRKWWDDLKGQDKAEMSWVPVVQFGLARKASTDLRLVNPDLADDPKSKLNATVSRVFENWKAGKEVTGVQVVFSNLYQSHDPTVQWLSEDLGIPNPHYGKPVFNAFYEMRRKLVALGVPEEQIGIFTDMTKPQIDVAADRLNAGSMRIAFGTTETLGTGLNIQKHITDIIHMDPQFRPMDWEQRNGRGIRQGNENSEVGIDALGVKNTMDTTLYQLMLRKGKFIAQAETEELADFEDPADENVMSFQQMTAAFSGNPLQAQRFSLENEERQLESIASSEMRRSSEARTSLAELRRDRPRFGRAIEAARKSAEIVGKAFPGEKVAIETVEVGGKKFTGKDANDALVENTATALDRLESELTEDYKTGKKFLLTGQLKDLKDPWGVQVSDDRQINLSVNGIPIWIQHKVVLRLKRSSESSPLTIEVYNRQSDFQTTGQDVVDLFYASERPWNSSVTAIAGSAQSPIGITNGFSRAKESFAKIDANETTGTQTMARMEVTLEEEAGKSSDVSSRLKEVRERLAGVRKQMESDTPVVQREATIEEIVKTYPQFAYITKQTSFDGADEVLARVKADIRKKQAKNFYVYSRSTESFLAVKRAAPIKLPGLTDIEFFSVKPKEGDKNGVATIYVAESGTQVASGPTIAKAQESAILSINSLGKDEFRKKRLALAFRRVSPRFISRYDADSFPLGEMVRWLNADAEYSSGILRGMNPDTGYASVQDSTGVEKDVPAHLIEVKNGAKGATLGTPATGERIDEYPERAYEFGDEAKSEVGEVSPQGASDQSGLPGTPGGNRGDSTAQASAEGRARRSERGLKESGPQTRFPGIPATAEALRARSMDEIEATLMRNGVQRDRAFEMLDAYYKIALSPASKRAVSPIKSEAEAVRISNAIRDFDDGKSFAWPKGLEHLARTTIFSSPNSDASAKYGDLLGTPPVQGTPAQEAVLSKVNGTLEDKRTLTEKFRDYLAALKDYVNNELQQKLVDSFAAIKRLERANFGANAIIDASVSAYKAARLTKNLPSVMDYLMNHGTLAYTGGGFSMKAGSKGLMQIFKPLIDAGTLRLWEGYVTAYRANRLLAEGKESNFGRTYDPATGKWNWDATKAQAEIDELLALGKQYPEFETVRQGYVDFQKSILDVAEAAGLINPASRAMWDKADYVPFYRITETLDGTGPRKKGGIADQRSGIKKLKGGAAPVAIMENIVRNIETMVDASFKNVAMQRVADLASGNSDMLVQIPYKAVPFKASVAEVMETLEKAGIDTTNLALTPDELAEFVKFWRMKAPKGKDVVSVMVDGKPIYYRVKDAALLRSVQSMGPKAHSWWMNVLMKPKQVLTGAVTLDPAFMAANTIRDSFSAWVISDAPIKPGIDTAKGFLKSLRNDPSKLAVMAAGGGSGHYNNLQGGKIRDYIRQLTPADRKSFLDSIVDTAAKAAKVYADIGRATENANRIAIADSVKKRGGTDAEAAFQALDIMDFGLRGDSALLGFFLDTVPFLNARIQGLYKLGRASGIGEGNGVTKYLPHGKHATYGAIITGATLALLASNWDDDRYWALPEWERDIYYHFWVGGQHVRIPKPFEVGQIFSTVPERMFEFLGKTGDGKLLGKRMLSMVADTFAMNPLPQVLKPMAERAMNLNTFTGGKIISRGDEFKTPENQFGVNTSETMRELAQAMPDSAPEWMRSPKTLEHFVRGYFGSIGMYALTASDAMTRAAGNYPAEPAMQRGDFWVMKRFAPSSDLREMKYVSQFYDLHQEISGVVRQIKELQKTDMVQAKALAGANADMLRFAPRATQTYETLQALRKQEERVRASNATPERKRDELAAIANRRNQAAQSTMQASPRRPWPLFNPFASR